MWYIVKIDDASNVRHVKVVRADSESAAIDIAFAELQLDTQVITVAYVREYEKEPNQNEINTAASRGGCPVDFVTVRW